ncbi:hypothetical protein RvY_02690 [Ramazzottius varieornatus]|uniref:Uncharacterized protein n=1 Tax=Ramazzottius varieornatus TaxID=947166 RepID=A0A1D1UV54_RAMVA|nr:hypothetical protein RvY_02690 [Ramazzottius varieornatus]
MACSLPEESVPVVCRNTCSKRYKEIHLLKVWSTYGEKNYAQNGPSNFTTSGLLMLAIQQSANRRALDDWAHLIKRRKYVKWSLIDGCSTAVNHRFIFISSGHVIELHVPVIDCIT